MITTYLHDKTVSCTHDANRQKYCNYACRKKSKGCKQAQQNLYASHISLNLDNSGVQFPEHFHSARRKRAPVAKLLTTYQP